MKNQKEKPQSRWEARLLRYKGEAAKSCEYVYNRKCDDGKKGKPNGEKVKNDDGECGG